MRHASVVPGLLLASMLGAATAQTTLLSLHGVPGDDFGRSVVAVGDANGDGIPDVAIAAPALASTGASGPPPSVRIVSGIDGATLVTITGAGDDQLGAALAAAGDVDLDGIVDLVLGAPGNPDDVDFVQLRSGADGHLLHAWTGSAGIGSVDQFGAAVAGGRDADGDGVPDVLVGAPGTSAQPLVLYAYAQLFSGASGQPLLTLTDTSWLEDYGAGVSLVDDADGDGLADVLLGVPYGVFSGDDGRLELRAGTTGALLANAPGQLHQGLGAWLRPIVDLSGDLVPELLVGCWGDPAIDLLDGATFQEWSPIDFNSPKPHSAHACLYGVFSGFPTIFAADDHAYVGDVNTGRLVGFAGLDFFPDYQYQGVPGDAIGTSVETLGDLNGDGVDEYAVGSRTGAAPGPYGGTVRVQSFKDFTPPLIYGSSCPGSGGFAPHLLPIHGGSPGEELELVTANGLGGAPALMLFGLQQASVPLPNGCKLLVSPVLSFTVPFALLSSGPGAGIASVEGVIPWDTPLGLVFTVQVFVADPGAPGHKCATNGVRIVVD
ncbi:MAG TPA: integrin alpha [Planctomycetota bacterium]|nr:integrin alpha [Planctomycetota bacterium]